MTEIKIGGEGGVNIKGKRVQVGGKIYEGDLVKRNDEVIEGKEIDPTSLGVEKMQSTPPLGSTTEPKVGSPEWKAALKAKIAEQSRNPGPDDVVIDGDVVGPQTIKAQGSLTITGDLVGRKKA